MQMQMWSLPKVTAIGGLAGIILATVGAFQVHDRYVSYAVLRVSRPDGAETDSRFVAERLGSLQEDLLNRRSLSEIIQNQNLYRGELKNLPLEDVVLSMNRDIQITPVRGTPESNVFQLAFQYSDPAGAQAVTRDLTSRLIWLNLSSAETSKAPAERMEVLDPANLPQRPIGPNRLAIAGMGLIVGLALGVAVWGVGRRVRAS